MPGTKYGETGYWPWTVRRVQLSAVTPELRGTGIGSLLITTALHHAEHLGWQFVVLLGHAHYYPRFGFQPAAALGLAGDYGDHDGWMARSLGTSKLSTGHIRYCSSFHA